MTRIGLALILLGCGSPTGSHTNNVEAPSSETPVEATQSGVERADSVESAELIEMSAAPVPVPSGLVEPNCDSTVQTLAEIESSVAPSEHGPRVSTAGGAFATWFVEESRLHMATYETDGSLMAPAEVALPIAAQRSSLEIADLGACTALSTLVWHSTQDRQLMLARWCPSEGFAPELEIRRAPAIESPTVARGPDGKVALAWYEGSQLHFALVEGQRTIAHTVLAESTLEGTPEIVFTGSHYLVFFTRSSMAHSGGLLVARADSNGEPLAHGELLRNPGGQLNAVRAARRGDEIGLVLTYDRDLVFVRVGLHGHRRGAVVLRKWRGNEGIGAGYRASSIVANEDGWWVGATRNDVRGDEYHYQSMALFTDGRGVSPPVEVGRGRRGTLGLSLTRLGDGVLGAYVREPWTGNDRVAAVHLCATQARLSPAQRVSSPPSAGPCEQAIHAMPIDRYAPVREVFDVVGIGEEFIVADLRRDQGLRLTRMTRDGLVRWNRSVAPAPAHHPRLALRGSEIALVYGQDEEAYVATFALDGTPKVAPRRMAVLDRSNPCIAASPNGYAIVASRLDSQGGQSTFLALDSSLDPGASAPLGAAMRCALAPAGEGWLWSPTRPGPDSGSNHLLAQRLDARGRVRGGEQVIVASGFARSPKLLPLGNGYQLLWTDPLYSRPRSSFRSVRLTSDGAPDGEAQEYGFATDVGGYGLTTDGDHARLVFAPHRSWVEHRLCPDRAGPHAPPRIHMPHSRMRD